MVCRELLLEERSDLLSHDSDACFLQVVTVTRTRCMSLRWLASGDEASDAVEDSADDCASPSSEEDERDDGFSERGATDFLPGFFEPRKGDSGERACREEGGDGEPECVLGAG